ncbi:MAG: CHASE2 domain-containing protein, partial [Burkholderiales bacterium]|nr:CHASE2 domain-containing protein [Burkholderiales bacterium]
MTPLRRGLRAVQRWRDEALIAALLALLAAGLALGGWAWRLDALVYDLGLSFSPRTVPQDVVIIAIDDASVAAIGRWPWPRAVHATLLDRLAHSHPRAVLLDLVLSEPDPDPRQDRLLARAMAEGAPVVLPVAWQALGGSELSAFEPVEPLRSAVRLGAAEASVDADGVLRHAFLSAGPAAAPYPNLALALLHAGGEQVAPGLAVRRADPDPQAGWRRDGRFLIRYVGPTGSFQRVSYVDVLRGAVPPERFDGRYVLIGMTAQGLGDTLATPMNGRYQAMPGIEAMANILTTLRSADAIRQVPDTGLAAGSAALVALLVFALRAARPRLALPLALL